MNYIFDFSACVVLHKVIKRSRLVVLLVSPWLNLKQVMCAIPMEGKTGEAIAKSVYMTLVEHSLHDKVMAALADTTAVNFAQWRGAMTILQVLQIYNLILYFTISLKEMLGYPVAVIPCAHHCMELIPST